MTNFSMETLNARRMYTDIIKVLKDHGHQPRLQYQTKLFSIVNEKFSY